MVELTDTGTTSLFKSSALSEVRAINASLARLILRAAWSVFPLVVWCARGRVVSV